MSGHEFGDLTDEEFDNYIGRTPRTIKKPSSQCQRLRRRINALESQVAATVEALKQDLAWMERHARDGLKGAREWEKESAWDQVRRMRAAIARAGEASHE